MTKIEALELELAARKMVGGTELDWRYVLRYGKGAGIASNTNIFTAARDSYELALGIIKGKPMFKGDTYYNSNGGQCIGVRPYTKEYLDTCSWNPPAPKTVMVEMLVEDAEWLIDIWKYQSATHTGNISRACRKALEGLK